jgi:hypothetical protein
LAPASISFSWGRSGLFDKTAVSRADRQRLMRFIEKVSVVFLMKYE